MNDIRDYIHDGKIKSAHEFAFYRRLQVVAVVRITQDTEQFFIRRYIGNEGICPFRFFVKRGENTIGNIIPEFAEHS